MDWQIKSMLTCRGLVVANSGIGMAQIKQQSEDSGGLVLDRRVYVQDGRNGGCEEMKAAAWRRSFVSSLTPYGIDGIQVGFSLP